MGAQNDADAERLLQLGCRKEAIHVVGSLKFDAAKLDDTRTLDVTSLLGQLGVVPDTVVLVAGSTHDGEERILASMYLRLKSRFPGSSSCSCQGIMNAVPLSEQNCRLWACDSSPAKTCGRTPGTKRGPRMPAGQHHR